jgi:hypothetical protein
MLMPSSSLIFYWFLMKCFNGAKGFFDYCWFGAGCFVIEFSRLGMIK